MSQIHRYLVDYIAHLRARLSIWWFDKRHILFYEQTPAPSPVVSPDGSENDSRNIQAAIDEAAKITNQDYIDAKVKYDSYKFKFLHRKPIIKLTAQLESGIYHIDNAIEIPSNMTLTGEPRYSTKITTRSTHEQ